MDAMKEAIKEAMLKVQSAVSELQEVLGGEEKAEGQEEIGEKVESEIDKPQDKAPEIEGKKEESGGPGFSNEVVEGAMGLDMPHQSKSSFAMKLKSKMGNKA